jgi:hypothetical protein
MELMEIRLSGNQAAGNQENRIPGRNEQICFSGNLIP